MHNIELAGEVRCLSPGFGLRPAIEAVQILSFEDHGDAVERCWRKFGGALDDAPNLRFFDSDGMHAGAERSQPMSKVDNLRARDAREEIFRASRKARDFVWKNRPADDQ